MSERSQKLSSQRTFCKSGIVRDRSAAGMAFQREGTAWQKPRALERTESLSVSAEVPVGQHGPPLLLEPSTHRVSWTWRSRKELPTAVQQSPPFPWDADQATHPAAGLPGPLTPVLEAHIPKGFSPLWPFMLWVLQLSVHLTNWATSLGDPWGGLCFAHHKSSGPAET